MKLIQNFGSTRDLVKLLADSKILFSDEEDIYQIIESILSGQIKGNSVRLEV